MHGRLLAFGVMCMAALWPLHSASAATVTHSSVEAFLSGKSDGLAVPIIEREIGTTPPFNGGVMVVPQPGTPILAENDFNYADQAAAENNGWFFVLNGNPAVPADPPSSVSFSAVPGSMRLSIGRPQDFFNPNIIDQSFPVIAARTEAVSGDFIVETRISFAEPRQRERVHGIVIGTYGDEFTPVAVTPDFRYIAVGPDGPATLGTAVRAYPTGSGEFPWNGFWGQHTAQSYIIRVVKRGLNFYSFARASESDPWVFQQWFHAPAEFNNDVVVGVYAKSWGGKDPADDIQNMDVDYFHVSQVSPQFIGEYTNVMDAGITANWRTISFLTQSMEGLTYQIRTGNTVEDGTLTDAGDFVGPDGTSATYYQEDTAGVIPNRDGKRYLEYRLVLDQTPSNLPASVLDVTATYEPTDLKTLWATTEADWGPDGGGISIQPGGGDISLTRTQVLFEDFSSPLGAEWSLREGDPAAIPLGTYNITERPGYLRLKIGYPQDLFIGNIDAGGVAALRTLPAGLTNYEVETEVNLEVQHNRAAGIHLWLDQNNFAGITVARRNYFHYDIGILGDVVLNDGLGLAPTVFYGSNTMQLRMTKVGTVVTASYRDAASPSPSWHILYTIDTEGIATGGADFVPTHVALLGKSYGEAARQNADADFNYLRVSSVAAAGSKDFTMTLPADSKADSLLIFGEGAGPASTRFQINGVGPDGTNATYFTTNEPKLPASLTNITNAQVTVQFDGTAVSGVPYLHAAAIQYATGDTAIARDTNRGDFEAGLVKNGIDTATVPGLITPTVATGTPITENFNTAPAGWSFSNLNAGTDPLATYAFTSGAARLTVPRPVDTWGQAPLEKPRAFLYQDTVVSGDYEIEAKLNVAEPRQMNRHGGIAIIASRPEGTTVDDKIDMAQVLMFGPYQEGEMRFMRFENNTGDFGAAGWAGQNFYIRVRKLGNTFIGYAKVNESDPWEEVATTTHPNLNNAYIGFLAKSWPGAANDIQNYEFDYLRYTPLSTSGAFESRVLDLGATGLYPWASSLGGNSASVQVQWRAANSEADLANAVYVGPDGTSGTTFAGTFGGYLPASLQGKRYFQYKAILPATSTINDIAVTGLTTGPVSPLGDVLTALRIAAGLDDASAAQVDALDIVKGDSEGKVELVDAVAAARAALGL